MKKLTVHSEIAYLISLTMLALSVAMLTAASFGVSMIVAPAYIVSKQFPVLTFGQSEYVVQGILFLVFCLLVRKIKAVYFVSFATGILYGAILDGIRALVPLFNENITPPGSMALWIRILLFVVGVPLTSLSIAIMYRIYLYPQVYDFFVKGITAHFHLNRVIFKRIFDASFFAISCLLTLAFFGRFVGVGWGTVVMTLINGVIIGWFDRLLERTVRFPAIFPRVEKAFALENSDEA